VQDDPDPPRKFYTMKAKEIERLNPAAGEQTKTGAISVRDHLTQPANLPPPRTAPAAAPPSVNDVQAIVQTNAAKEHAAGLNDVAMGRPRQPSRRKRDYITTLLLGNGVILFFTAFAGINAISLLFGFAGVILFSSSATWVIWQVMDDY
jgi:hypothetical protein